MKPLENYSDIKTKHTYDVYLVGKGTGCYKEDYRRIYIGTTKAISEAKACNNVRYKIMKDKENPNGGYSSWVQGDYLDEGYVIYKYEAIKVD